jgi:hypothetical protein
LEAHVEVFKIIMIIDETTQPCSNLRDVTLLQFNAIKGKGFIFRSGHLRNLYTRMDVINKFKTIISFLPEPDHFSAPSDVGELRLVHVPFDGPDKDAYNAADNTEIQRWIFNCIDAIATAIRGGNYPILFHCFSGKDRTGIIAATLLVIAGCSHDDILADYAASDGKLYIESIISYLQSVDSKIISILPKGHIQVIREILLRPPDCTELRIGYLPRKQCFNFNSFEWKVDNYGRLSSVNGRLILRSDAGNTEGVKLFKEDNVIHTECIHNAIIYRHPSDRWIPLIPIVFGGLPSRFNEILICKSALRELGSFYKGISRDCLVACDSSRPLKVEVPIQITLQYFETAESCGHGIQRPNLLLINVANTNNVNKNEADVTAIAERETIYISNVA